MRDKVKVLHLILQVSIFEVWNICQNKDTTSL